MLFWNILLPVINIIFVLIEWRMGKIPKRSFDIRSRSEWFQDGSSTGPAEDDNGE